MTSISKNVYINKLDDIVNKYNNTYHSSIKMEPADVKSGTYIDSSREINNKDSRLKIVDIVWISKHENLFAKGCVPNWSEKASVVKKAKNTAPWTYVISDIDGEDIVRTFYKIELQKKIKTSLALK